MRFQPGEGPSRGLLRDCTTSPINRFAALITTLSSKSKGFSDDGGEIRHILPFKKIQIYNDTMGFGLIFNWSR